MKGDEDKIRELTQHLVMAVNGESGECGVSAEQRGMTAEVTYHLCFCSFC